AITRAADRLHLSWGRARQPGGRASRSASPFLVAAGATTSGDGASGSVRRGSGKTRSERTRKGPGKCRVCRKSLVTAEERTLGRCRTCPSDVNEPLLEALREWRLGESRERAVPAYVIFTDATLIAIAEQNPGDADSLLEIPGIGPKKLDVYGEALLDLVGSHT
ncbi:MAG: HRDC domain-containing protein, partial [bacterium]|nr:HRDC domain-containing protein [bacterium]